MAVRNWALRDLERILGSPPTRGTTFLPGLKRLSYVVWYCFPAGEEPSRDRPTNGCPAVCVATSGEYDSEVPMPGDGWTIDPCPTHRATFDEIDSRDRLLDAGSLTHDDLRNDDEHE